MQLCVANLAIGLIVFGFAAWLWNKTKTYTNRAMFIIVRIVAVWVGLLGVGFALTSIAALAR